MRASLFLALILPLSATSLPASAARLPAFEPGETVEVGAVVDGGEVTLVDGRSVRLVGIDAPHFGNSHRASPLAEKSKAALEKMVLGREVELRFANNRLDRHGRVLAHLFVGKRWVQGEMLRRGLARVESAGDNRLGVSAMLARESNAREARRGIWRDPSYAVRDAEEAGRYAGSFQIVEGTIVDTGRARDGLFLNFAEDWRSAFSLRLAPETLRLFRAEGVDALSLKGAQVRVRGWIRGSERPTIDITHPEQIERL